METGEVKDIRKQLSEPFHPSEVSWKPQSVRGNRALAVCYIDARCVMDRLDDVVGVGAWQDDYEITADGSVICSLKVLIGGEWIRKTDVGSPSEQPDGGDRTKAAFSDALKRTAVKFGVGRYLYSLPMQWEDYDPVKKHFVNIPRLPDWALPADMRAVNQNPGPAKSPPVSPPPANRSAPSNLPSDGRELHNRLVDMEKKLIAQGKCKATDLVAYISRKGEDTMGWSPDISTWEDDQVKMACDWAGKSPWFAEPTNRGGPAVTVEMVRAKVAEVYGADIREWLRYTKLPNLDALKMAQADQLAKWHAGLCKILAEK